MARADAMFMQPRPILNAALWKNGPRDSNDARSTPAGNARTAPVQGAVRIRPGNITRLNSRRSLRLAAISLIQDYWREHCFANAFLMVSMILRESVEVDEHPAREPIDSTWKWPGHKADVSAVLRLIEFYRRRHFPA